MEGNKYIYPITVQFEDIDSYGIIHNPQILNFMERARCGFYVDHGYNIQPGKADVGLVMRDIHVRIKGQILMFDKIDIELTTSNIDEYSFEFNYVFRKDGKSVVSATTQNVYVDPAQLRMIPIPQDQLDFIKTIEKPEKK